VEPPAAAAPPAPDQNFFRRNAVAFAFLAPALILLFVWIVYPTIYTIIRSFSGKQAHEGFLPYATTSVSPTTRRSSRLTSS